MRRRGDALRIVGLWLGLATAVSGEAAVVDVLEVHARDGRLVVSARARDLLDDRTRSTIESGLPGSGRLEFTLERRDGATTRRRVLERTLRLDLWRDRYVHEAGGERTEFRTLAAADSAWSRMDDVVLARLAELDAEREYRVRLVVSVEPLRAEDRGKVSRFVRQGSDTREEFRLDLSALMRRWFGGGTEAEEAGATTPWFRPRELSP